MSTELATRPAETGIVPFDSEKLDLLKRTICKNATNDELELFVHACKRTGLDPFMKQIHAVKRYDPQSGREVMAIQTGIDGYRLIAERTDRYMPGKEPAYEYNQKNELVKATAFIQKLDKLGRWHEVAASALYDEYVGTKKGGEPNSMWRSKPHIMLAKCAEALALRRAFPAELSGVYTSEEMAQADNFVSVRAEPIDEAAHPPHVDDVPTAPQIDTLADDNTWLAALDEAYATRGIPPSKAAESVTAIVKGMKVGGILELSVSQRNSVIRGIANGNADKYKTPVEQAAA